MRLTSINLYSSVDSEALTFSLNPEDEAAKYQVKNLAGLDAEDIVPKFYGKGVSAGSPSRFYDMGMKARDIVLNVVLRPNLANNETYSDIRDALYRQISGSRTGGVTLRFFDGAQLVAGISGFITKFEVPHMVRTPEVTLTIRCDDPMIRGINPVRWLYGTTEHPGTSPISVPDSTSTAPHGFSFSLACHTATPDLTIQDQPANPSWVFQVVPDGGFVVGDTLYFSSDYADRYLYVDGPFGVIHLVDKLTPESVWPIVFPGQNLFYMSDLTKFDWVNYLQYYPTFWGV